MRQSAPTTPAGMSVVRFEKNFVVASSSLDEGDEDEEMSSAISSFIERPKEKGSAKIIFLRKGVGID